MSARWLPGVASDYSLGMELVDKLLFRVFWSQGTRRWHRLDGHEHKVDEFATRLPVTTPVLSAYASYLYRIGEGALPRAFMVVADKIGAGDPNELLSDGNTMYCLESLLTRYVYGQPLLLRIEPNLRKAVLAYLGPPCRRWIFGGIQNARRFCYAVVLRPQLGMSSVNCFGYCGGRRRESPGYVGPMPHCPTYLGLPFS